MKKKLTKPRKKETKEDGKIEVIRVIKPDIQIIEKKPEQKKEDYNGSLDDFLDEYNDLLDISKDKFQKTSLEQSSIGDNLEKEVEGVPIAPKAEDENKPLSYGPSKPGGDAYIEAKGYTTSLNRGSYETTNSSGTQIRSTDFKFDNPDFQMLHDNKDKYDQHNHYTSQAPEDEESPFKSSKEKKRRF